MITICNYSFEGPYSLEKEIIDRAAVYVILSASDNVVDVGQSGEAGTRLSTHDRKSCWDRNGGKWFAVMWTPSDEYTVEERRAIEKRIREEENPPCGAI